jgi:2-amino-4-hydroxy-6-hydroxymethyldihydropteridine diphosphokinase
MNKVFLGLGSNVGDRLDNISNVIKKLESNHKFSDVKYSSIYETKPYGKIEQNNFLNCVVSFITDLSILDLFEYVKKLEKKIGRIKREVWGPREIDIDILLFGDLIYEYGKIRIPHKDLLNRDFVLVPLLELDENIVHPENNELIKNSLEILDEHFIISKNKIKNLNTIKVN